MTPRVSNTVDASSKAKAASDAMLGELVYQAAKLPIDVQASLLAFTASLTRDDARRMTPKVMRRAADRLRILKVYADTRSAHPTWSERRVLREVVPQARRLAPDAHCSANTISNWVSNFNRPGDGGLALAWASLIDRYGVGGSAPRTRKLRLPSNAD